MIVIIGVPLGLNVESLSIFKEEINGAHELFQVLILNICCSGTVNMMIINLPQSTPTPSIVFDRKNPRVFELIRGRIT